MKKISTRNKNKKKTKVPTSSHGETGIVVTPKVASSKLNSGNGRQGQGSSGNHTPASERPWLAKYYFKPGDKSIKRTGAPKPFAHVHRLAQEIGDEEVEITIGEGAGKQTLVVTRTELILLDWSLSSNPQKQQLFMEYAHGKVPNVNYNQNMTMLLRQYADRLTDAEIERIKEGESVLDILISKIPKVIDV